MEIGTMFSRSWLRFLSSGSLPRLRPSSQRRLRQRQRAGGKPTLELLEDRLAPATLTVNTTADNTTDTSVLTLRDAITLVNNAGNPTSLGQSSMPTGWAAQINTTNPFGTNDTIVFALPDTLKTAGQNWWTIQPLSALPGITDTVLVDGWSQAGAGPGLAPNVMVDGSTMAGVITGPFDGLDVGANGCVIRGLAIRNFTGGSGRSGIFVGGNNATIQGCYLGLDPSGNKTALGNDYGINDDGLHTMIGGANPGEGNVISGNTYGIVNSSTFSGSGTDTLIRGNRIGTNPSGTTAIPNAVAGINIGGPSPLTPATIGGSGPGDGNLISGNGQYGIQVVSHERILGNLIGTDVTGMHALGNGWDGIFANNYTSPTNLDLVIGGTDPGSRNVISGNDQYAGPYGGIEIQSDSIGGATIQGNYIGTDINGAPTLGNGREDIGVGTNCLIGGTAAGAGNLIADSPAGVGLYGSNNQVIGNVIYDNVEAGVGSRGLNNQIIGNTIHDNRGNGVQINGGPDGGLPLGVYAQSNTVSANSIYANGGLGIALQPTDPNTGHWVAGVVLNDSMGHDGPNHLQNFPVLASALTYGTNTTITGTFSEAAEPNTAIKLEFYINAVPDPSGYGQGQTYLGSAGVLTDGSGNAGFSVTLPVAVTRGQYVTATATDPRGDTSEFCQALQVPLQVASTTIVTASANPSVLNQSVTFTATVTPAVPINLTPTGTVQFQIDGVNFGSLVALTTAGTAISGPTTALAVGPHTITAIYSGDGGFLGSSGSLTQAVHYTFSGFLAPLNRTMPAGSLGKQIPIKFQLKDVTGNPVPFATVTAAISAVTSLQVQLVDSSGNPLAAPFTPTTNTGMTYDSVTQQFTFSWQTKGLSAGYYNILLGLNDGTVQTKIIQLVTTGKSAGLTTGAAGGTGSTGASALLAGDIDLYVDNSNGDLTADELARIQDAVTAADAVTAQYGVEVAEVTDPTLADVTLNMDTTSAVGGYAAGVLGCTTDAGQISIINGWNFYAGSPGAPGQIGSAQYDFETVVTHELGHALGLGHSTDSTSVMYATLNTGTVNRTLTTADLNVADTDTTGACGLRAAVEVGRVSGPSYDEVGRVLLFAFAGTALVELPVAAGSETRAEQRSWSALPVDAVFAGMSERPIFAGHSQRESDDPLSDMPLFPGPDKSDPVDSIVDFMLADSMV
jgi:hypothetical protein